MTGIRWFRQKVRCECAADATLTSGVRAARRGQPPRMKRAQMVWHYRRSDEAWFWHWSDATDLTGVAP